MGYKIVLTVRHIRGRSFDIECNADADTLGIKVLIWEAQKIPIEKQRLVFSGREMDDGATLKELEIADGTTIFLVEAGTGSSATASPSAEVNECSNIIIQPMGMAHVPPALNSVTVNVIPPALHANVPAPHAYQYLDEESIAEERIAQVVALSKWVRMYFVLGMFLSLFAFIRCVFAYCLLGAFVMLSISTIFLIGFIAGRRLHRCLLMVPALLVGMVGFFGFFAIMYAWIAYVHSMWMFIPLLITVMHMVVFSCICRLMTRIGFLTNSQFRQSRARIQKLCCLC